MREYVLTATLDGTGTSRFRLIEDTDSAAMLDAIDVIMEKAMKDVIWAKGRIEMRDSTGRLINVMEAK